MMSKIYNRMNGTQKVYLLSCVRPSGVIYDRVIEDLRFRGFDAHENLPDFGARAVGSYDEIPGFLGAVFEERCHCISIRCDATQSFVALENVRG
jgi:hypothetical protein